MVFKFTYIIVKELLIGILSSRKVSLLSNEYDYYELSKWIRRYQRSNGLMYNKVGRGFVLKVE